MLSNMEQVMAKTDITLAENYAGLSESPEKAAVIFGMIKEEYQRSRKALLDLLQNHLQAEIVRLLAGHGNVMVVGDDAQSIYSFRGADFANTTQIGRASCRERV